MTTEVLQRKFIKPTAISESLKCIICSDVFVNPVRLYCSHTFCKICLDGIMKSKDSCPMCRDKIDKKKWGPDRIAQNIIDELQVFCPVQDCPWKGLNSQLDLHYNQECTMKNLVKNSGKSHKKTKLFNLDMLPDEGVEQKINENMIKGSLGARLQLARKKQSNQTGFAVIRQTNESLLSNEENLEKIEQKIETRQNKKKKDRVQKEKHATCDFLQELFE